MRIQANDTFCGGKNYLKVQSSWVEILLIVEILKWIKTYLLVQVFKLFFSLWEVIGTPLPQSEDVICKLFKEGIITTGKNLYILHI